LVGVAGVVDVGVFDGNVVGSDDGFGKDEDVVLGDDGSLWDGLLGTTVEPAGIGTFVWPGDGGGSTEVVGWPSGPTLTTVVGVAEVGSPGTPVPGMVVGSPGTPLPWTTWMPGVVP
jgi:hypothetical protein